MNAKEAIEHSRDFGDSPEVDGDDEAENVYLAAACDWRETVGRITTYYGGSDENAGWVVRAVRED